MTIPPPRPMPEITDLTRDFWTGGAKAELRIYRCSACGFWSHPPTPICMRCRSRDMHPQAASGLGRVFSFTVNHQAWRPGLIVPYVVAIVELTEQRGLRLTTNIVSAERHEIEIGMKVMVTFIEQDDVFIPVFRPSETKAVRLVNL
jgi:uncharacterized protein